MNYISPPHVPGIRSHISVRMPQYLPEGISSDLRQRHDLSSVEHFNMRK